MTGLLCMGHLRAVGGLPHQGRGAELAASQAGAQQGLNHLGVQQRLIRVYTLDHTQSIPCQLIFALGHVTSRVMHPDVGFLRLHTQTRNSYL